MNRQVGTQKGRQKGYFATFSPYFGYLQTLIDLIDVFSFLNLYV